LHLAGVLHASQQYLALGEVDDHATIAVGAVTLGLADEVRRIEDLPLVLAGRIVLLGIDEQGTAEQVVPGGFGFHRNRQVLLVAGTHVYTRSVAGTFSPVVLHSAPQGIQLVSRA